jgi:hypothetical protein
LERMWHHRNQYFLSRKKNQAQKIKIFVFSSYEDDVPWLNDMATLALCRSEYILCRRKDAASRVWSSLFVIFITFRMLYMINRSLDLLQKKGACHLQLWYCRLTTWWHIC